MVGSVAFVFGSKTANSDQVAQKILIRHKVNAHPADVQGGRFLYAWKIILYLVAVVCTQLPQIVIHLVERVMAQLYL